METRGKGHWLRDTDYAGRPSPTAVKAPVLSFHFEGEPVRGRARRIVDRGNADRDRDIPARSTVRVGRPDDEAIRTAVVGVGCVNDFSATTRPIEASVGGRRYTRHIECVSLPIAYVQRAILHERVFLEHERGGRDDRRAVPWRGVAAAAGSEQ